MTYKISKINLRDINYYLDTLNKTKSKNSLKKKKLIEQIITIGGLKI